MKLVQAIPDSWQIVKSIYAQNGDPYIPPDESIEPPKINSLVGSILYDAQTGEGWELYSYKQAARRNVPEKTVYRLIQRSAASQRTGRLSGRTRSLSGTWRLPTGHIATIGADGTFGPSRVLREGEGPVGPVSGDLVETEVPGVYINPNTGAVVDTRTGAAGASAGEQHGYDVALEQLKQAFQQEQARLDHERALELQRLQEENAMKRARLGEAGSLARTAAEVQQRARQWIAENQGVDLARAFIGSQGMAQRGRTGAQQFTSQLEGIASAPIPQVSEDASLPEIEQVIQSLQGQQQAPVMPSLGFAAGGTIDMTSNAEGVFEAMPPETSMIPLGSTPTEGPPMTPSLGGPQAQMGTTKRAILVGEKGGFTGDEEVVIIDQAQPGKVEVIPLMAGAAEGGMFDSDFIFQTLAPIYKKLGLAGVGQRSPTGQGGAYSPFGRRASGGGNEVLGGSQYLSALGYRPNLIRDVSSGNTYYKDSSGTLHHLSPEAWNAAKFQIGDVLNVAPNEISQFGPIGAPQTQAPELAEEPYRRGAMRSIPFSVPQPGGADIPLPDIRSIAGIWRYLDPNTQGLLASFYGVGGLGGLPGSTANPTANALAQIQDIVRSMSPAGTGRTGAAHF